MPVEEPSQHQFLTPAPQQMSFILRSDHSDHPAFLKPSICRSWSTTRIHEESFRTKYAKFRGDTSIAIFKALLASNFTKVSERRCLQAICVRLVRTESNKTIRSIDRALEVTRIEVRCGTHSIHTHIKGSCGLARMALLSAARASFG